MTDTWGKIAAQYAIERETVSFNAVLLDTLVCKLTEEYGRGGALLDFGAGIGTMSKLLAHYFSKITAVEPSADMRGFMKSELAGFRHISIEPSLAVDANRTTFQTILCLNVLDHIEDFVHTLSSFYDVLSDEGTLILSLPHPMKDIGDWEKEYKDGIWKYLHYRLDGYLTDQKCSKTREDADGNVTVKEVVSFHRTISTYYNAILGAGFRVIQMQEPVPDRIYQSELPVVYSKSSRIPYFWLLVCKKETWHEH